MKALKLFNFQNILRVSVIFVLFSCVNIHSQWFPVAQFSDLILNDIKFINQSTGFISGYRFSNPYPGKIFKTTNSGENWTEVFSQNEVILSLDAMSFPSQNTGYFLYSFSGTTYIYKTTNTGTTWNRIAFGLTFPAVNGSYFLDENTGFAVDEVGFIIKTTDGGNNWSWSNPISDARWVTVNFKNYLTGFAIGADGAIGKTTNGGLYWEQIPTGVTNYLTSIQFSDQNTGYISGYDNGVFFKTTNGGNNWFIRNNLSYHMNDLYFLDNNTGFVCGAGGTIYKTYNGGLNFEAQNSLTSKALLSITFINSQTGFACGDSGVIRKTTNGGVIGITSQSLEIPDKFSLHQNYPNPFNPVTNIKFDLPKSGNVMLKVYNANGREVTTLTNEFLQAGSYTADFDGTKLSSGVYFYSINSGDFVQTRKMILVK
jgi:photosystem II stability/assembly factor-like uncharacterized protein